MPVGKYIADRRMCKLLRSVAINGSPALKETPENTGQNHRTDSVVILHLHLQPSMCFPAEISNLSPAHHIYFPAARRTSQPSRYSSFVNKKEEQGKILELSHLTEQRDLMERDHKETVSFVQKNFNSRSNYLAERCKHSSLHPAHRHTLQSPISSAATHLQASTSPRIFRWSLKGSCTSESTDRGDPKSPPKSHQVISPICPALPQGCCRRQGELMESSQCPTAVPCPNGTSCPWGHFPAD